MTTLITMCVALAAWSLGSLSRPQVHRLVSVPTPSRRPHASRLHRRSRSTEVERSLPDAIELVVLAVRAGHLPYAALCTALPHLHESLQATFTDVVERTAAGERFADALRLLTERLGPSLAPLADSLAAADRYGLPLAPVLDRLAGEARQQRRRQVDTAARQLPVRLAAPLVLCTLPSFVLLAVVPLLLAALSSLHS